MLVVVVVVVVVVVAVATPLHSFNFCARGIP